MNAKIINELKKSVVKEIAPDVWLVEGYVGDNFGQVPPSSNCYIIRDEDTVYVLDPGYHPFYRGRMLEIINRFKNDGVKYLTLMVTQGHFDHASNNLIAPESGLTWKFLLQEPEVKTIHFVEDIMRDILELERYENVYSTMFPWEGEMAVIRLADKLSTGLARSIVHRAFGKLMGSAETLLGSANILRLEDRIVRKFGSTTLTGWSVGRFFAVHDESHTAGHISLYDPKNKILFCGDVTIEINPAFFYSSIDKLIEASGNFHRMALEGHIDMVADAHRSKTFLAPLFDKYRIAPLHDTQMVDVTNGLKESAGFLGMFNEYYSQLKKGVLEAHAKTGAAEVRDIVEELSASPYPAVRLKKAMRWPRFPSRMDVLVASILKEAGVRPQKEGKRIVLYPAAT